MSQQHQDNQHRKGGSVMRNPFSGVSDASPRTRVFASQGAAEREADRMAADAGKPAAVVFSSGGHGAGDGYPYAACALAAAEQRCRQYGAEISYRTEAKTAVQTQAESGAVAAGEAGTA